MAFRALSVGLGLALAAAGVMLGWGLIRDERRAKALPRARLAGEALAVVCLVWSAYHGSLMLEGGLAVYRKVLWAMVPVTAILVYGHLDYLFARALGGLLVLTASQLIHGAFAAQVPGRVLYSLACYLVGLWGMSLMACPWWFRDLLLGAVRGASWRRPLAAVGLASGAVFVLWPWLSRQAS